MTGAPAWVRNGRMDFLAANRLGYAADAVVRLQASCRHGGR